MSTPCPEPAVLVRDAGPADAAFIAACNAAMALETESRVLDSRIAMRGVTQGLARPDLCRYFVAECDGRLVGQLMITYEWSDWRAGLFWWIQSVYVEKAFRRQGVFRALQEHVSAAARTDAGVCGLRLYVDEHNARAIDTYRNLGFVPSGHLVYEVDWSGAIRDV